MVAVRTSVQTPRAAMNVAVNKALHSCQTTGRVLVREIFGTLQLKWLISVFLKCNFFLILKLL